MTAAPEVDLPRHLRKLRLRRREAVEYLERVHGIVVACATLAKWATTGGGPPFSRLNRSPLYLKSDLDQWVDAKLVPADTAKTGGVG